MAPLSIGTAPAIPSEYYMCSAAECIERQSSGEISVFESKCPPPTSIYDSTHPNKEKQQNGRRIVDPRFAMTKYRRSAAGGDTKNRSLPRSSEQLQCCLSHLEYILCHQQRVSSGTNNCNVEMDCHSFPKQTFAGTVSFVEDRIRAMQVDMVLSQTHSAALQYRMVRCHMLILYILGTFPTYETRFGEKALMTALTNYWEDKTRDKAFDEEILCFMALQQLTQYFLSGAEGTETLSVILDYYRRNVEKQHRRLSNFPKFEWAMKLVDLAMRGCPRSILRQLVDQGDTSFAILCRCCISPVVDLLRTQTLDQCNKSYMKGEKVRSEEIAHLLYFDGADDARAFAHKTAGLTLHEDEDCIVFKVGPIHENHDKNAVRRQDAWVFGSFYDWKCLEERHSSSSLFSAWDDCPPKIIGSTSSNVRTENKVIDSKRVGNEGARIDAEGVIVPPPVLLQRMICGFAL